MRKIVSGLLSLRIYPVLTAQSILIGKVSDTLKKAPLQNAVVTLFQKSTLPD